MPTYLYRGTECGHEFEVRQSFADEPLTACTICGKPARRVITPAPIVFKGTGWYITDSKPTHDSSGGVQDPSKKTEKKASESSESVPATSDKPATESTTSKD